MKTCKRCRVEKEDTCFEVCKIVRGKAYRRLKCSECKQKRATERRALVRAWLEGVKRTLSCSRCGFSDHRALEFHHTGQEDKEVNIADMAKDGRSIRAIKRELQKCVVLCANCHRIEHYVEPVQVAIA